MRGGKKAHCCPCSALTVAISQGGRSDRAGPVCIVSGTQQRACSDLVESAR